MSSANLKVSVDPRDLGDIKKALNYFTIAVQDRIAKTALRRFANDEIAKIRSINSAVLTPSHLKQKIRVFRSGIIWLGVGYNDPPGSVPKTAGAGRARRRAYDSMGVGWRSHFQELGFHSWAKGMPHPGKQLGQLYRGRGWKRKLRHRGRGTYHRGSRASELVHKLMAPKVLSYLWVEIKFAIDKASSGKRARRMAVGTFG